MTGPGQGGEASFSPARRQRPRLGRQEADSPDLDQRDLERGRSDALLGALGRIQLRLDVLAQQQPEALERVLALLESMDRRMALLEKHVSSSAAGTQSMPTSAGAQDGDVS